MNVLKRLGLVGALMAMLASPAAVQAQFKCTTNNGTVIITHYISTNTTVTIPDTTNGLPVTSIGDRAFSYRTCGNITIPDGVTSIGKSAFFCCQCLTNATIGNGVTTIGNNAFGDCVRLTTVTIGNAVASIGFGAFLRCGLTSVTMPASVTSIGRAAFSQCSGLTNITVNASNPTYGSVGGVLFDKGGTTLVQCPGGKTGTYTIPNGVTNIEVEAFSGCTSLTDVSIPASVISGGIRVRP